MRGISGPYLAAIVFAAAVVSGCSRPTQSMDSLAEQYVRLTLAVGQHDPDYVDAYYGPAEWKPGDQKSSLDDIGGRVAELQSQLSKVPAASDEMVELRRHYLTKQVSAMAARIRMLKGERLSFDEEARALYDVDVPRLPDSQFQQVLDQLEARFPGQGALVDRYEAYRLGFVIPRDRLDSVFTTAINACRERTARHMTLPAGERFRVEYVTGKSWSGYNWYQGGSRSLIQVNTDLPIYIDRAVDLACHEGYPGHHVYNALLEKSLVKDRGWIEFTVYPLFSPQSLIAEGSANYGIEMAFPGDERITYEREQLFPLAGLDTARAAEYYRVQELVEQLTYAGNEAARRYLNGEIDAKAAADWMVRYELRTPASAAQRVRFIDQYRSYVINYNLGKDLVREYVERSGSTADERWRVFSELLSSPRLPSGLSR